MPKETVMLSQNLNPFVQGVLKDDYELVTMPEGGPGALGEKAADIRAVVAFGGFSGVEMDALPNLEIIACPGVGYDGIDTSHAAERGIIVTHTPNVLNDEVADTAIALLLNAVRRLYAAERYLREGRWETEGSFPLSPFSVKGRKVGLYGLGRIGLEIASRLEPFKVDISYHTRSPKKGVDYAYHPTLASLAEAVDTLICIVPKTPETHKVVNAEILSALGPDGILVNVGRGWSVDEDALIAALEAGTIGGAGLDVFYEEPHVPEKLRGFDNVSLLPHVASASVPTRQGMAQLVADNLKGWFAEGRPVTPVPETPVPPKA
ncbi:2-hydroxyacid dehydrogenase [Martelella lutilitoris]|uniref:2-hydroxyacid dehydrogenase n=1 Tax=Martelella lutilitoris TaxID=2583532 RepID=A0A5C4JQ24_9HYPH|nr:2-hydroxyacid dehydrogenase [Martelella lutilitoris]TNB47506.1 2-hydroxyacid dehydrogenase [Martelella lutilitoris]